MTINIFMSKIEILEQQCHTLAPMKAYLSRNSLEGDKMVFSQCKLTDYKQNIINSIINDYSLPL